MRLTLLFVALWPFALTAQPTARAGDEIVHFETGVICAPETVGTAPAPGTVAGTTNIIATDPPFVSTGNRVPAVLGIGFGVKAKVGDPAGIDEVLVTITHPPMGRDGAEVQTFASRISGIDPSLTFYQFDYTYELVTGPWTIRAEKDGRVIYKAAFQVLPPQMVPELAAICGFEDLLS